MEINSRLNEIKEFLENNVCNRIRLKAETKTKDYELVNPKCFIFAPRDTRHDNLNYPFISIEFDEIEDDGLTEVYNIQLYVFVFDNGTNVLEESGNRSYYPNKGQGYITLFNFLSVIRRAIIIDANMSKLLKSGIGIKMLEGIEPPYYGAVILFKLEGLPYPRAYGMEIQDFLKNL